MRRILPLLVLLAALAWAPAALAQCMDFGDYWAAVHGPESRDNLWQFAICNCGSHSHLVYSNLDGHFHATQQVCNAVYAGQTLQWRAHYTESENQLLQKAWFAVTSFEVTLGGKGEVAGTTMREVPEAAAVQDAGTVTVSWMGVSAQDEVLGYRVQRSADGISSWTTVANPAWGTDLCTDAPGSGDWHYAVLIRYAEDPEGYHYSPHGLSACVTVP